MIRTAVFVGALLPVAAFAAPAPTAGYDYELFDVPNAPLTIAFGVNEAGQIVGGTGTAGFLRTRDKYSTITVPGSKSTQAYGINNGGRIVGFYSDAAGFHGFEKSSTFTSIDYPGATTTFSFAINLENRVVGAYVINGHYYGYKYYEGQYSSISVPGEVAGTGNGTQAHGINQVGQIVGFYSQGVDPTTQRNKVGGFLDTRGVITTFGFPGAYATEAEGINDSGDIVGTYGLPDGTGHGFLLHNGTYTTLDVPGATKSEVQAINDRGEIIGWAVVGGKFRGFTATPHRK